MILIKVIFIPADLIGVNAHLTYAKKSLFHDKGTNDRDFKEIYSLDVKYRYSSGV